MRLFFGAFVLNFMLFFNEIEASETFKTNLLLQKYKVDKDRNKVDSLDTSRIATLSALRQNPTSRGHEDLDLHRPIPDVQESTQQTFAKSSKRVEERGDIVSTPRTTVQSAPTHSPPLAEHQAESGVGNEYSSVPQRRRRRARINPFSKESKEIEAKMAEARRMHGLSYREHSNLLQQRFRHDNPQLDGRIEFREEDAIKEFQRHYPEGLPYPLPQPQFVDSVTPARKPRRRTKLTVRRKVVSNPHEKVSQQSESSDNDMSGDNPYLEVSLDTNGNHNLRYNWDHSGSSGSSSQN